MIGVYLISFPKGTRARCISLKCCFPNGMPIIVIQRRTPQNKCVRAIQNPPIMIHIIFITRLRQPGAESFDSTWLPNGHIASIPSLKACSPKGMPMMVNNITNPEMNYSMAIIKPPQINHIIFPIVFIRNLCLKVFK